MKIIEAIIISIIAAALIFHASVMRDLSERIAIVEQKLK